MSKSKKDESQAARFIETARKLGCDEDEIAFEKKLKAIVTAKPLKRQRRKSRAG